MDREKVLTLYDAYSEDVYRLAYSFFLNSHDAEDAVQEVFLRLMSRNLTWMPGKEQALLARITANYCKDCLRKNKRFSSMAEKDDCRIVSNDSAEQLELQELLLKLPPVYRAVIYLHYYVGYRPTEIAKILAITPSGVFMRLSRARKLLKENLGDENIANH